MTDPERAIVTPDEPIEGVAIVGMAGRFPGARDVAEFWTKLVAGAEGITRFGDAETHDPAARSWVVNAGGVIEDIELFDADFFAMPPAEAAWMDPQHRLFLECAWLALEDAGCPPSALPAGVAVYAGTNINSYVLERLDQLAGMDRAHFMQILVGNEKDFLATRVSYKLHLRGESITVQTSCSTSLVALHLACQSLMSGQCDRALAGGVSIRVPQITGYTYEAGMISSPDGHCRPFDHRARGTVPGNGVGVVVLKRLEDAIADRDHCYAVIRGSWMNNDGRGKVGFTAPSVDGQAEVIARALGMAGVAPDTVRFVETHGTGTVIGDPIEFEALRRGYRQNTRRRSCALGAVKASIGHLDTAAGVAGLIKTALALHHRVVPPSPHFERPNAAIDFDNSPFYINTEPEPWPRGGAPRRAAVSSFGVGGTNVHVVLEEAPARVRAAAARPVQIVTISAKTAQSARAAADGLAQFVETRPDLELRDVAYTRNVCREMFGHRRYAVASDVNELARSLRTDVRTEPTGRPPSVAFMFTGQGTPRLGMARALYVGEARFRDAIEGCFARLEQRLAERLRDLTCVRHDADAEAEAQLARPEYALPALFAIEYALVQLWRAWGIAPSAVIGHSYGELVGACVAGVFGVDAAIALAVERGRLMQRMPPGRMLSVPLGEGEVARFVDRQVTLAAINGDQRVVLSGPTAAIEAVHRQLQSSGVDAQWLNVPFAYHSTLLDPLLADYQALIAQRRPAAPAIRSMSNLTADWLTDEQAADGHYWAMQMRKPVRFAEGLRRLRDAGHTVFVEIGPGQTLAALARQALGPRATVCASLGRRAADSDADWRTLLDTLGRLWTAGTPVEWREVERAQQGWAVPLPGYAFARRRHWIETTRRPAASEAAPAADDRAAVATRVAADAAAPDGPAAAGEPARGTLERTLIDIWTDVLGRSVSVEDNLFELGADSLTAMRMLSRLEQALPVAVTMEQILTASTIAELVAALEESAPAARPAVVTGDSEALSFAQEWLWTQQRLVPTSAAYHLPLTVRLRGRFDTATFADAIRDVVARQEALRTAFVLADGRPAAIVRPANAPHVPIIDLSGCPVAEQEREARGIATAQIAQLFDMAQAPPWRACLVALAPDDHIVIFVLHHIIADGWSMSILINEVTMRYVARRMGQTLALPPLPMQYRQFAQQQRADLDRDGGALVAYWKRQLADVPPLLTLSSRPRPAVKSYYGGRHAIVVEPSLVERLSAVGRRERATLFMVLLASYQALLFRLTGQEDFCVGAPTAGRLRQETEAIIGCFINTLPIRADVSGSPTCVDLLQRVRRTVLDAFAHQALPFGRLVQELRPQRSPSYTPIFQVIFDFNSTPPPAPPPFSELSVEPFGAPLPTAKTDLIVDLWRGADGELLGAMEYDRALFDAAEIERLGAAFVRVLEAIAANPDRDVNTLPLESEDERARRAQAEHRRDAQRRERLAAIKGGRRSHVTHNH